MLIIQWICSFKGGQLRFIVFLNQQEWESESGQWPTAQKVLGQKATTAAATAGLPNAVKGKEATRGQRYSII